MLYKYHCACCEEALSSYNKACPKCGSHHIRSPINLWVFCVVTCFAAVLVFKLVHIYIEDTQDTQTQPFILDVLNQDNTHVPKK